MTRPRFRRLAAFGLLIVSLSACEMTVRFTTKLNSEGGGTFAIGMQLDRELREQLEGIDASGESVSGLASIETLFQGLHAKGWITERTEPAGGLTLSAERRFVDSKDFDRTLSELGSARASGPAGNVALELDYATQRSFLRTTSRFNGTIDTSGEGVLDEATKAVLKELAPVVHFEMRAEMPGGLGDVTGGGSTDGRAVVWRPDLGTALAFGATSSALRIGSLLALVVPGLALLGALAWFGLGRRKDEEAPLAIIPDEPRAPADV